MCDVNTTVLASSEKEGDLYKCVRIQKYLLCLGWLDAHACFDIDIMTCPYFSPMVSKLKKKKCNTQILEGTLTMPVCIPFMF